MFSDLTFHFFPQTWYLQLHLRDFFYGKDILGNAVSKGMQIFQEDAKIIDAPSKPALDFVVSVMFLVTV